MTVFRKHWPLVAAFALLGFVITALLIGSLRRNDGHLVYVLDDPYIHMAMAKNLVRHGTWGVNPGSFSSTSSSPLWTGLLALVYVLTGVNELVPFVLEIILASLLLLTCYLLLNKSGVKPLFKLAILSAVIFFAPLPALVLGGQEHILHALITVLFVSLTASHLSGPRGDTKQFIVLLLLAALLPMTRYEGFFLILIASGLFVIRKRPLRGLFLVAAGSLPIALYGAISLAQGWFFLPNPVMLKGRIPELSSLLSLSGLFGALSEFGRWAYLQIRFNLYMPMLLLAAFVVLFLRSRGRKRVRSEITLMIAIFICIAFLHMYFARQDWFFRYEAYLVILGLLAVGIGVQECLSLGLIPCQGGKSMLKNLVFCAVGLLLLFYLFGRARDSFVFTPQAATNIYQQQYQMGLFLKEYYQEKPIAANDIGAINFLADINCLDLCGLGTLETAELLQAGDYAPQQIYLLAQRGGVKIAVVYDFLFRWCGGLPPPWMKVGEWRISNNVVGGGGLEGGETVSFYAVDPTEREQLISNLRRFSSRLPFGVRQRGVYTRTPQ